MRDFIRKNHKAIGIVFIVAAFLLFADKAIDLGPEAVPLLGEIMIGVVLFTVGYAFVMHTRKHEKTEAEENRKKDND